MRNSLIEFGSQISESRKKIFDVEEGQQKEDLATTQQITISFIRNDLLAPTLLLYIKSVSFGVDNTLAIGFNKENIEKKLYEALKQCTPTVSGLYKTNLNALHGGRAGVIETLEKHSENLLKVQLPFFHRMHGTVDNSNGKSMGMYEGAYEGVMWGLFQVGELYNVIKHDISMTKHHYNRNKISKDRKHQYLWDVASSRIRNQIAHRAVIAKGESSNDGSFENRMLMTVLSLKTKMETYDAVADESSVADSSTVAFEGEQYVQEYDDDDEEDDNISTTTDQHTDAISTSEVEDDGNDVYDYDGNFDVLLEDDDHLLFMDRSKEESCLPQSLLVDLM